MYVCEKVYDITVCANYGGFAVVDMREISYSEPHYHSKNAIEIYILLEGSATIVVGNEIVFSKKSAIIITPPLTAHYVIPDKDWVIGCINLPNFKVEEYHAISQTDATFKFDRQQFEELIAQKNKSSLEFEF